MVLTVEPCHVPSLKGSFHRKIKEAGTRAGLETHPSDNLVVSDARLVGRRHFLTEES
jgi:hypothetical protein